ncbi:HipA domain-containing protein [Veillonella sp. CHU732]|uniref:HipA domain-containing protein n=1 Tax=Veillonella sp. CHU732 TaxID=2490949 RepID=UPI000F8E8885|nr:HipA domain-containing protein [Veillonella sp. CHU732]
MRDFTGCRINTFKTYGGANGNKLGIYIDEEQYLLKFPPVSKNRDELSYTHGCVNEHISSSIYNLLSIPAQQTELGIYQRANKTKIVVACKDFVADDEEFRDFASLKNTVITSESSGYSKDLSDILFCIYEQDRIDPVQVEERFWDMFVVDSLVGNFDRHNGNWGFLVNKSTHIWKLAPVYDCGSTLLPSASIELLKAILNDADLLNERIYRFPNSAVTIDGKKANMFEVLTEYPNKQLEHSLESIVQKIDMEEIFALIESIELIRVEQKDFYKLYIEERKKKLLDTAIMHRKNR